MCICYGGYLSNTTRQGYIAQHFDLLDTNINSAHAGYVNNVKAINPDILVIGYKDYCVSDSDWSDWSTVNANETNFMHTTSGGRITRASDTTQYLMNPNGNWKTYWGSSLSALLLAYPQYAGVFIDEATKYQMEPEMAWSAPYTQFGDGYSKTNWYTWTDAFFTYQKNLLGNKLMMPNTYKDDTTLASITGSCFWEHFCHATTASYTNNGYGWTSGWSGGLLAVNYLYAQSSAGKIIACDAGCTDGTDAQMQRWAKFCYGMYTFTVTDVTKAYFCWNFAGQEFSGKPTWYPFMDDLSLTDSYATGGAPNLGQPTTQYYNVTGRVYAREFDNYYVVCNTDDLGSADKTITYKSMSYTMPARTAIFIKR